MTITRGDKHGGLDSGRRDRDVGSERAIRRRAFKAGWKAALFEAALDLEVATLEERFRDALAEFEAEAGYEGLDGLHPWDAGQEASQEG